MQKTLYALTLLCFSLPAVDARAQGGDEHREAIKHGWTFNYDAARAAARRTNRPLMVVFRCVP